MGTPTHRGPRSYRRLFAQGHTDGTVARAADLGFGFAVKQAGSVVVDDRHQLARIEAAGTDARQRMDAVLGLFRKKQVNAVRSAEERGDEHALDLVSGWCDWISDQTLIAYDRLMSDLRALGYDQPNGT